MITPRLLLLYNFGIALLFVVIALFSMAILEPALTRTAVVPPFDVASQNAIHAEQDLERLRARAAFYFELGRDLKRARYADTDTLFADLRKISFAIAIAFAIGGVLSFQVIKKPAAPRY
jgi:hypothetical protein